VFGAKLHLKIFVYSGDWLYILIFAHLMMDMWPEGGGGNLPTFPFSEYIQRRTLVFITKIYLYYFLNRFLLKKYNTGVGPV
jgi:hypothetical protein